MRLFIAIQFSDEVKSVLLGAINELRAQAEEGYFTRPENLHLTLAFIGETDRLRSVRGVIDECADESFDITIGGSGRFGALYWAGIKRCEKLEALADRIQNGLREQGFEIENREFKPHITLARQVAADKPIRLNIPETTMSVSRISLMKSERINGKLCYTEVYGRTLR